MFKIPILIKPLFILIAFSVLTACASPSNAETSAEQRTSKKVTFEDLYVEGDRDATYQNMAAHNFGKPFMNQADKAPYVRAILNSTHFVSLWTKLVGDIEGKEEKARICENLLHKVKTQNIQAREPNAFYASWVDYHKATGCKLEEFTNYEPYKARNSWDTKLYPEGDMYVFEMPEGESLVVAEKIAAQIYNKVEPTPQARTYLIEPGCRVKAHRELSAYEYNRETTGYWLVDKDFTLVDTDMDRAYFFVPTPKKGRLEDVCLFGR